MATATELVTRLVTTYLSFLGYDDRPPPTLESLAELHRRHLARVPYENLAIMLGRPPSVQPLDSLERIATLGRAGYCFHQNGALETVLVDLGYAVSRRAGAVWDSDEERRARALNHLVLVVSGLPTEVNPGGEWWPDVGLGDAIAEPLPLVAGDYEQGGFRYAITEVRDDGWSFRADAQGSFEGLEVGPAPTLAEVVECHTTLSTPPGGHFTRVLVVQRRMAEHVDVVRGCLSTRITPGGKDESELTTYDEWRGAIADGCGLSLAAVGDDELRALFDRQLVIHREFMESRS
jgi:N-hydroxyarylamine O-acetyltransferase